MKQAAAGAASATQAVKADKKPFFSQRTLSHFIDFLFVLPALILLGVFTYYPIVKLVQIIGLPAVDWLNQQSTALPSVLMLTGWRVIGYGMMIYLSAMMGISQEYYEAASLDGANGVQKFFRITLPLLSPTTLFLLVTTFLSSMKVFQSVDILTSGGPARSTEVFVYLIYRYAMVDFRMDRAATAAVMFFLILLVITVLTMKVSDRSVTYDS